jgi:hypothetical protein
MQLLLALVTDKLHMADVFEVDLHLHGLPTNNAPLPYSDLFWLLGGFFFRAPARSYGCIIALSGAKLLEGR